jgi:penicillin-binding protein 1A
MDYAHQGIELKQLPGVPVPTARQQSVVADARSKNAEPPPLRPVALTKRGADILVRVERLMDEANRSGGRLPAPVDTKRGVALDRGGAIASTSEGVAIRRPGQN